MPRYGKLTSEEAACSGNNVSETDPASVFGPRSSWSFWLVALVVREGQSYCGASKTEAEGEKPTDAKRECEMRGLVGSHLWLKIRLVS